MSEFKAKITIAQLLRLTIVSAKSKIYSPRRSYLSPGNSIILEIAATLLFIGVTSFCHDYIKCIRFSKENTKNCKKGEEAHKETIRAYGAMGFLKLD